MGKSFWTSAKLLFNYKPQLALAAIGVLVSAACFGAGMGMILPVLHLLLGRQKTLRDLAQEYLVNNPDLPNFFHDYAQSLADYIPQDKFQGFVLVMLVIAALSLIGSIGRFIHEYLTITIASRATMVWRDQIFAHLVQVPLATSMQTGYADQINRLINDTRVLADGLQNIIGRTLAEILKSIAVLIAAFVINWQITLLALVGAPVIAVLFRKFGKKIHKASKRAMGQRGRMSAALNEALGGINVVKVHNAEGYERRRFRRLAKALFTEEMKMRAVKAYSSPLIESLTIFGIIALAILAAWLILNRHVVNPQQFVAVLVLLGGASGSLKPLSTLNNNLHEASAAADRLAEMLQLPIEQQNPAPHAPQNILPRHHNDVRFEHLAFTYPRQERPAVRDANLHVNFGQTVAIVGANGSGKTTLLNTLPRLLVPTSGAVRIDGVDVNQVSLRSLRSQIAVVSQQSVLFQATIAQNIAYARLHEPMHKIIAAAKAAYADEFIADLPKGYNTMLGEDGSGLSGGQRQRLCIARAILRNPAILILDEATSQIDADSEAKINRALHEFRHGRTTFIIAHRLSTVIDADLIVVMHEGRIIDQGRHAQLLDRCSVYQTLTQTQLMNTAPAHLPAISAP